MKTRVHFVLDIKGSGRKTTTRGLDMELADAQDLVLDLVDQIVEHPDFDRLGRWAGQVMEALA